MKTLVKGKPKAFFAGFVCSGQYTTLLFNVQMKPVQTYFFIKFNDAAAFVNYCELLTSCVSVLNLYGFTGYLS